ncbi:MAG: hypothetical protein RL660_2761 [Bacteroidota bacterium]|jgi:hypothetical protein
MNLNLFAYDIDDEALLLKSFNAFYAKSSISLELDPVVNDYVLQSIITRVNLNPSHELSIQNLFRLNRNGSSFLVAQLLLDKSFDDTGKGGHTAERDYEFLVCGICETTLDLGSTVISLETRVDKMLKRFWIKDVEIGNAIDFNEKYKIITSEKESLTKFLNLRLMTELEKQDDLVIVAQNHKVILSFNSGLEPQQTRVLERLFECMQFIK